MRTRFRAASRRCVTERAFTLIGRSLGAEGLIPADKLEETATVVGEQAERARELGAERIRAVATAAIRRAANARELVEAVEHEAGMPLDVLQGEEEARLAFQGAARAAGVLGSLAVIDVGGGSTEIAVGAAGGRVLHAESIPDRLVAAGRAPPARRPADRTRSSRGCGRRSPEHSRDSSPSRWITP